MPTVYTSIYFFKFPRSTSLTRSLRGRLTIILTEHLEGQKQRFENSYCLRLAEILGRLNIKVIKVEEKAIQKLDLKDRVDFYIRKALDSYKSASARREAP